MRYRIHPHHELFGRSLSDYSQRNPQQIRANALASGMEIPRSGAIDFTKLMSSSLSLNRQLHILFYDGVIEEIAEKRVETVCFRKK